MNFSYDFRSEPSPAARRSPTLTQPAGEPSNGKTRFQLARSMAYPLLINFWPVLLYVSQKAFAPIGLLLNGLGDGRYQRDLALALLITIAAGLVYIDQPWNEYRDLHVLGVLAFVWGMPVINKAIRDDKSVLLKLISFATLFNVGMGFYVLYFNIDLTEYRGLNRIETTDGYTTRIYFESASLAAVYWFSTFRNIIVRLACLALVAVFIVLIAKSVVIILLFGLNLAFPYLLRSSAPFKVATAVAGVAAAYLIYRYIAVLRPDVFLSLQAKEYQLQVILSLWDGSWKGWGWGTFLPALSTDIDQPYQVEMQLPMLLLQVGPVSLLAMMGATLALFLSAADRTVIGVARCVIYFMIGLNNPWLFIPSWYLTCQLLFRQDAQGSAARSSRTEQSS